MKKAIIRAVTLAIALLILLASALCEATPPISRGVVLKTANIHWGKSEAFPVLATVFPGTRLDVYEYDRTWALVRHDTAVRQGTEFKIIAFYGYISRDALVCDPPLEGEASDKADTGPGKKKGKRPKPGPTAAPAPTGAPVTDAPATPQPAPTVEPMEEFDWIIRTNGLQTQTVELMGVPVKCSFSLMAQKAGGSAPSSDPAFNHGMRVPYAATAAFYIRISMSDTLDTLGLGGVAIGTGGADVAMSTAGATFFLDTGAEDFALVNFSLRMQAQATLDAAVQADTGGASIEAETGKSTMTAEQAIPVQLRKSGGGYKFVLVGVRPGGGNLEFPAVLEKTFADEDRFDKEAKKADERRKQAEEAERKRKAEEKRKADEEAAATPEPLAPLEPVTIPPLEPVTIPPLEPVTLPPLAPVTIPPLTPVNDLPPPVPVTPVNDDDAPPFPQPQSDAQRRTTLCA